MPKRPRFAGGLLSCAKLSDFLFASVFVFFLQILNYTFFVVVRFTSAVLRAYTLYGFENISIMMHVILFLALLYPRFLI